MACNKIGIHYYRSIMYDIELTCFNHYEARSYETLLQNRLRLEKKFSSNSLFTTFIWILFYSQVVCVHVCVNGISEKSLVIYFGIKDYYNIYIKSKIIFFLLVERLSSLELFHNTSQETRIFIRDY